MKERERTVPFRPGRRERVQVQPASLANTKGLSDVPEASTESVEELVEEGQSLEAALISGVEDAPDADVAEVHTKQVPEDDVPPEYLETDETR